MPNVTPGNIVKVGDLRRVVVDVVDYTEENDGGLQDVFCVLRLPDDDPSRRTDSEGGDMYLTAVRVSEITEVLGHIDD